MRRKRKRKGAGKFCLLLAVMLIFCLIGTGFSFLTDRMGWFKSDREIVVEIPSGAGLLAISDSLHQNGIIKHPRYFSMIAGKDPSRLYQKGRHTLSPTMSYNEIADKLARIPDGGVSDLVKVAIPEGFELRQIADAVAESGLVSREAFMKEAESGSFDYAFLKGITRRENRLEGYLFPATYSFEPGVSAHDIVNAMLKKFDEVVPPLVENADTDFSLDEVVTLASMIEREAVDDSERGKVSSVFYNRMERDMTLSSCATIQYVIQERKPILSNSDIKIDSPYNTYQHKGLPIGPIASPGEKSVEAALHPDDTDYLYFAAHADGSGNEFSKTGEEHLKTVDRLQSNAN